MSKEICVITFTVDRVPLLIRCIKSVLAQQISVRHLVFSENHAALIKDERLDFCRPTTTFLPLEGIPHHGPSSPRMATLRQYSLSFVTEPYLCFLDDDNEMETDHLHTLLEIIKQRKVFAAYSWRHLLHADGTAFNGRSYPWHSDTHEAHKRWQWCIAAGVMTAGESLMRDGPVSIDDPMRLATVDMNEWLFDAATLKKIGMNAQFSDTDIVNRVGEDDKLFARIRSLELPIAGSGLPTIRYYLGGVSNYRTN